MIKSHFLKQKKDCQSNKIAYLIGLFLIFSSTIYCQNVDSLKIQKLYKQIEISYNNKQLEQCRDYAEEILRIDNSNYNAYMLLGRIYASIPIDYLKEIAQETIDRQMIYCLIVDMFEKASEMDTSCYMEARRNIDIYSKYFPNAEEEGWFFPEAGTEYKIGGWINRKTKIRVYNRNK